MSEDPFDDIEQMLSALFGAEVAGDAVAALRSSGRRSRSVRPR